MNNLISLFESTPFRDTYRTLTTGDDLALAEILNAEASHLCRCSSAVSNSLGTDSAASFNCFMDAFLLTLVKYKMFNLAFTKVLIHLHDPDWCRVQAGEIFKEGRNYYAKTESLLVILFKPFSDGVYDSLFEAERIRRDTRDGILVAIELLRRSS